MLFSCLVVPTPTPEHTQRECLHFLKACTGRHPYRQTATSHSGFRSPQRSHCDVLTAGEAHSSLWTRCLTDSLVLLGVPPSGHHRGGSDPAFCARAQERQRGPDGSVPQDQNLLGLRHESPRQEVRPVFRSKRVQSSAPPSL